MAEIAPGTDRIKDIHQAFRELLAEANGLVILARSHGRGLDPTGLISAQQQVLRALAAGPKTVPTLARERFTSRQNIQIVVNRLMELHLVETSVNPNHRRSKLVRLLPAGDAAWRSIEVTQAGGTLPFAPAAVKAEELARAVRTLRAVRESWLGDSHDSSANEGNKLSTTAAPGSDPAPAAVPPALEPSVGYQGDLPVNLL